MSYRPRRSVLFLPAANPRAIEKARGLPCDTVILDLEDAVAPEMKAEARDRAVATVREGGFGRRELVVRINALDTEWGAADARALGAAGADAVLLPKVDTLDQLRAARAALGSDVPLWAMIETVRAMMALPGIAEGAGAVGLALLVAGTNDLARELRCRPGVDRMPLVPHLAAMVLAARLGGLVALDGVCNAIDDPERVAAEAAQALALGFDGKTLIHPSQIEPANRVFTSDAAAVADAEAVVAAFADPAHAGRGALRVNGRMVERLHLEEAERMLAMAAAG